MGDMALEMGLQEMGYPQEDVKPRLDVRQPRYAELFSRIRRTQDEINETIGDLNAKLEFVRDMRDDEKSPMAAPAAADEPNVCNLEEGLDELHREAVRIQRRLNVLLSEIRL